VFSFASTRISAWLRDGLTWKEIKLKILYAMIVGGSTFINFATKTTLLMYDVPLVCAVPVAYFFGGQCNFVGHNLVTFRVHPSHGSYVWQRWRRFTGGNVLSLPFNTVALLLYTGLGLSNVPAFFAALLTSGPVNWWYNRHYSFVDAKSTSQPDSQERGDI
jgi:putative flippase GtrA